MSSELNKAIEMLRSAVAAKPYDLEIREKLVIALVRIQHFVEAISEFVGFVRIQPHWTQLHFELVARLVILGDGHAFRKCFESAVDAQPKEAWLWYGLGLTCQTLYDQSSAVRAFRRGISCDSSIAALYYNLGVALLDRDDTQAILQHEKAISLAPQIAEPHFALGAIYMRHGQKDKAAYHFRTFLQLAQPYLTQYIDQAQFSLQVIGLADKDGR